MNFSKLTAYVLSLTGCAWQLSTICARYFNYDVITTIEIVIATAVKIPAMTVCFPKMPPNGVTLDGTNLTQYEIHKLSPDSELFEKLTNSEHMSGIKFQKSIMERKSIVRLCYTFDFKPPVTLSLEDTDVNIMSIRFNSSFFNYNQRMLIYL